MNIIQTQRKFSLFMNDITDSCNARCIFCANTFDHRPSLMSKQEFLNILKISDYSNGTTLINCQYEPTLHPAFAEFMACIPSNINRTLITTNLVRMLSDAECSILSTCNISTINVSIESLDEQRNAYLMGVKKSNSQANLQKLQEAFNKRGGDPLA